MAIDSGDVKDILDTDLTVSEINPFLDDAKSLDLNDRATVWLTAHLVSMYDKRVDRETSGPIRASYEGETGMGLESTRYGQMALFFDDSGTLKEMNAEKDTFFDVY